MLHPIIPFITEYIYQKITCHEKILNSKFEVIEAKKIKKDEIWQIDCLLSLKRAIQSLQREKDGAKRFFLGFTDKYKKKTKAFSFIFNHYLKLLVKAEVVIIEEEKNNDFDSFVDLQPFAIL